MAAGDEQDCNDGLKKETIVGKLRSLLCVRVEPVGRWFEAHAARRHRTHSQSHGSLPAQDSSSDESEVEVIDEAEDDTFLLTLDPKEWKNQDHYAVIGLGKTRYRASTAQVKAAYKSKVLRHHPDKRKARGEEIKDESKDYFPCITRAWEVLGDPLKRISYDSVDPEFDDAIPHEKEVKSDNFFSLFGPVFARNSRWSRRKPVPLLGSANDSFDEVDNFYSFWYELDSWREYSYLDEEDKERGEDRYERRYIEKQNKEARKKRKKEEMARIRQLVELANKCDPRIARFKEEAKKKKADEKQARRDFAKRKLEEEERTRREAEERVQKEKAEEEAAAREQAAQAKKEREAQKKAVKKERKALRTFVKDQDYYSGGDDSLRVAHMTEVDRLAELLDVMQLQELNTKLQKSDDNGKEAFTTAISALTQRLAAEKQQQADQLHQHGAGAAGGKKGMRGKPWRAEETQALIRAMQLVPQGTADRWEVVAQFMSQHCQGCSRTAKEVLAMSKELQQSDLSSAMKDDINRRAFEKSLQLKGDKEHHNMKNPGDISQRFMSAGEAQVAEGGSNTAPWSKEEQQLLEQALRKFPAGPDRWDKIAGTLPARSKKDCMLRYKELVELVKAKKAAAAKGAKS